MIRSPLRAALALACALSLSACGGSKGDVYVGGTATGVTKDGLVVTNNDGPPLEVKGTASGTASFLFPDLVATDATYNVKVVASPANTEGANGGPGCAVVQGTGTGKAVFNISTVRIVCTLKTFPLTANISGLKNTGLELVNGPDHKVVAAGATSVAMEKIPEGAAYGIAVLKQPDNQTCTVANGTGTMDAVGKSVNVTCTP